MKSDKKSIRIWPRPQKINNKLYKNMTTLTQQEIINFWLRVYLGTSDVQRLQLSAVDRAYRDFNRTMHGLGIVQTNESYNTLRHFVSNIVSETLDVTFDQLSFDNWHLKKCDELKAEFIRVLNYGITYGQAQKWINMTLKYMFAIGPNIINGIDRNYSLFHIPLDNIIQDKLLSHNIVRIPTRWSRIDNYQIYFQYQIRVRNSFPGQIPLDVEFRLFNE
jgi:hypothetical protein